MRHLKWCCWVKGHLSCSQHPTHTRVRTRRVRYVKVAIVQVLSRWVVSNVTCPPPNILTTNGKLISPAFPGSICWHLGTETPRWPRHAVASHPDVSSGRCRLAPGRNSWPVWPEARSLLILPSAWSGCILWSLKIDRLTPLKWLRWQGGKGRGGWDGKCLHRTSYSGAVKQSMGWPPDLKNAKSIF